MMIVLQISFKNKTFSGYKKNDILNAVMKSIESKKIENACHWTCECIVSGYSLKLWEKLLNFSAKIIHINNPKLPYYLYRKNLVFMNQINRLNTNQRINIYILEIVKWYVIYFLMLYVH